MAMSIRCVAAILRNGTATTLQWQGCRGFFKPARLPRKRVQCFCDGLICLLMTQNVQIPLWLLILILLFAAVTALSHFLLPSVRWFFRKRMERVVTQMNTRLARPIEPFKLARRHDMIQRIIYDPEVTAAIVEHAEDQGMPENVAFEQARRYAREIVPSFSATAYFSFGMRLAKWLSRSFYRVRLGNFDREELSAIEPDATVIFVMNHRSNMDYVLVTHLVSQASTLSYAVGEWARVWPLSAIIKAMGAYFIRRRSRGTLYRKILARYVQMATENGVTQAFFPEGGLSLTGRTMEPKYGLLNYVISGLGAEGCDVIFVPVAINYDHVIEDRVLIKAGQDGNRRFGVKLTKAAGVILRYLGQRLTGRFRKLGAASVSFGTPMSYQDFAAGRSEDLTEEIGQALMDRIRAVVPVVPVPLIATSLLAQGTVASEVQLVRDVEAMLTELAAKGAALPRRTAAQLVPDTLPDLVRRKIIKRDGDTITFDEADRAVLEYYRASIEHLMDATAAKSAEISATAG